MTVTLGDVVVACLIVFLLGVSLVATTTGGWQTVGAVMVVGPIVLMMCLW